MGGHAEVDLTRLRAVADHVAEAAGAIAEIRWSQMDLNALLSGSAVSGVAAPDVIAARVHDVVTSMRGWARAAHMSADALERSDIRSADRIRPA